jgi:hypothetical protein
LQHHLCSTTFAIFSISHCLFGASNLILYDKLQHVIELERTSAINTISTANPTIKITTRNIA